MKRVIYDLGANNGDDIPYYLLKGDVVVAVEANPDLCEQIRSRFKDDLQSGRLILENCVVTAGQERSEVSFYLHKENHVLSQLPRPDPSVLEKYDQISLPCKSVADIVNAYGSPFYIKIDIEHYDAPILQSLFQQKYHPPYISAESHTINVFAILLAQGGYNAFKLVDGQSVSSVYANRIIQCGRTKELVEYSFPYHSAGPFGGDIDGEWLTADNFFRLLCFEGLGWKDIHASNVETPNLLACARPSDYFERLIRRDQILDYCRGKNDILYDLVNPGSITRSIGSRVKKMFRHIAG